MSPHSGVADAPVCLHEDEAQHPYQPLAFLGLHIVRVNCGFQLVQFQICLLCFLQVNNNLKLFFLL